MFSSSSSSAFQPASSAFGNNNAFLLQPSKLQLQPQQYQQQPQQHQQQPQQQDNSAQEFLRAIEYYKQNPPAPPPSIRSCNIDWKGYREQASSSMLFVMSWEFRMINWILNHSPIIFSIYEQCQQQQQQQQQMGLNLVVYNPPNNHQIFSIPFSQKNQIPRARNRTDEVAVFALKCYSSKMNNNAPLPVLVFMTDGQPLTGKETEDEKEKKLPTGFFFHLPALNQSFWPSRDFAQFSECLYQLYEAKQFNCYYNCYQ